MARRYSFDRFSFQVSEAIIMWKTDRRDFLVFLVVFLVVLFDDVVRCSHLDIA